MMNPWPILLVLLFALGAGGAGYFKGRADSEAKHATAWAKAQEKETIAGIELAAVESERLALVEANRMISRALEGQAYAEPISVASCMPASRGLRINQRIEAANHAAAGKP